MSFIMEDIQWLGYKWATFTMPPTASATVDFAVKLIRGKAYCRRQSAEEIGRRRNTHRPAPTVPIDRPVEEPLPS